MDKWLKQLEKDGFEITAASKAKLAQTQKDRSLQSMLSYLAQLIQGISSHLLVSQKNTEINTKVIVHLAKQMEDGKKVKKWTSTIYRDNEGYIEEVVTIRDGN